MGARVAVSNAVSLPLDNVIFVVVAFGAAAVPRRPRADAAVGSGVGHLRRQPHREGAWCRVASLPLIYVTPDRDWDVDAERDLTDTR